MVCVKEISRPKSRLETSKKKEKEMNIKHPNGANDQKRTEHLDQTRKLKEELDEERNENVILPYVNENLSPEMELPF